MDINEVQAFTEQRIADWDQRRIGMLNMLSLDTLLSPHPYSFVTERSRSAGDVISMALDAAQAAHERETLAEWLFDLAVFVADSTGQGRPSAVPGIDLECSSNGISFLVSIMPYCTADSDLQIRVREQALRQATTGRDAIRVQPTIGICIGKAETSYQRGYLKVVGSDFWRLIGGDEDLYRAIVQPIAAQVKTCRGSFAQEHARIVNRFTHQFIEHFCDESGAIDWVKLVEFNSGNFDARVPGA
ncbi:MAG: PmeII family type II restriction endonuclease [Anaerolineae bacterium]|uniref:PmeII family type II restriction endonuclease n=1 Tax=Candidatus Amarolinea dominans TaxID=3140696 RepID=UPI0031366C95|nr:hypothetical protein [Anaerolineae bacterium]